MSTPTSPTLVTDQRPGRGGPFGCVPATGSTRRLQALAAAGWPVRTIARLTRLSVRTVPRIRAGQREWVQGPVAARIAEVYDVLGGRDPDQCLPHTAAAARAIRYTRVAALHAGWRHVDDWVGVDMDDPSTSPADEARRPADDRARNTTAGELLDLIDARADLPRRAAAWYRMGNDEKRATVAALIARGHSVEQAADLVGVHSRAIQRFRDLTQPVLRDPAPCTRRMVRKAAA